MTETKAADTKAADTKATTDTKAADVKAADSKAAIEAKNEPAKPADAKAPVTVQTVTADAKVKDRAAQLESEGMGPNEALATAKAEAAARQRAEEEAKGGKTKTPKASDLAGAGESGDPAVQKLLADRQGLVMNLDSLRPQQTLPADSDAADIVEARIADIDERLARMGFRAS